MRDKIKTVPFGSVKFPELKGHMKMTLTDIHTGKERVYEADNVITDAVKDIFANNYLGMVDYSKLWGSDGLWKTWFGGIMCYNQQHSNLDTDDYFMPDASDNAVIAHAGQTAVDPDHDDDLTRGNPVASSYEEDENMHKVVFEWGPTRGNGIIRAVSLTHSDTGSYGNGMSSYHFKNSFVPLASIKSSDLTDITVLPYASAKNNLIAMYDDNHGIGYVIGDDGEYGATVLSDSMFETDKLTIFVRRLPYLKAGLFETLSARTSYERRFVAELPFNLYSMPSYYFDPENKYLWIFSNINGLVDWGGSNWSIVANNNYSKSQMKYAVIDCSEDSEGSIVDSGVLTGANDDLSPSGIAKYRGASFQKFIGDDFHGIAVDDTYIYLPTSSDTPDYGDFSQRHKWKHNGFRMINKSTGVDEGGITFEEAKDNCTSPIVCGNLLVENNRVCNGSVGYTCSGLFPETYNEHEKDYIVRAYQEINKASTVVIPVVHYQNYDTPQYLSTTYPRFVIANKLVNTSKLNVNPAKEKSASETMRIEYTITETGA